MCQPRGALTGRPPTDLPPESHLQDHPHAHGADHHSDEEAPLAVAPERDGDGENYVVFNILCHNYKDI